MLPPARNAFDAERIRKHGATPVFLIRHGQTLWNKERRFLGRSDIPLNDLGHQQAVNLSRALAEVPFTHVYSSPLTRAKQTAEAITQSRGMVPIVSPGLTELNQGELEGMHGTLLPERYPDFYKNWQIDPTHVRIPGGETLAECHQRSTKALFSLLASHTAADCIAIVSHKVAISSILCDVMGLPPRFNMMVEQANTAINLLRCGADGVSIVRLNDHDHV